MMATYDARPSSFTQLTTTSDWESILSAAGIPDGIDGVNGGGMVPSLDTVGRNAVITAGQAIIKGQLWRCDASVSTPIPAASAQNRIDRLVLQLNRTATTSPTVVQPVVVTGTPGSSPVEPPLTQTPTGIWQVPVCSWTSTSAGAITSLVDERDFAFDSWHDVAAGSLPSGVTVSNSVCRYKMVRSNLVKIEFSLSIAASVAATTPFNLWTMPTNYWPSKTQIKMGGLGYFTNGETTIAQVTALLNMRFSVTNTGLVQCLAFVGGASGTGITELDYTGEYALD